MKFILQRWSALGRPRRFLLAGAAVLALWVLFFDSHSVVDRILWKREAAVLSGENEVLRAEIEQIKEDISHADDPEVVERVARETYGMRKDGETVYRVEQVGE